MRLKKTVYETIEITEDDECGMTIGNILLDEGRILYAEIVDCTISNRDELAKMRAFLDEVEKAMTPAMPTREVGDADTFTVSWGKGWG